MKTMKSKRGQERRYNISLGYDYPAFWYLDFSVLISFIDVFWDRYFYAILKTPKIKSKKELISRLRNILPVRNAIAHHRYVSNLDIGDLDILFRVLKASLNKDYINNFNEIALHSFEGLVKGFLDSCDEINEMIRKGRHVDALRLRKMKSSFSAVVSVKESETGIDEFEQLLAIIGRYNRLPRKPGRGDEFSSFLKETGIEARISSLQKIVGDFI